MLRLNKFMRGSALIRFPASHTTLGGPVGWTSSDLLLAGLPSAGCLWRLSLGDSSQYFEALEESVRRFGGIKADSLSVISSVIASAAVVLQLAAIQFSIQ